MNSIFRIYIFVMIALAASCGGTDDSPLKLSDRASPEKPLSGLEPIYMFEVTRENTPDLRAATRSFASYNLCQRRLGSSQTFYSFCVDSEVFEGDMCPSRYENKFGPAIPAADIVGGQEFRLACGSAGSEFSVFNFETGSFDLLVPAEELYAFCLGKVDEDFIASIPAMFMGIYGIPVVHSEIKGHEVTLYLNTVDSFWGDVNDELIFDIMEQISQKFDLEPAQKCKGNSL